MKIYIKVQKKNNIFKRFNINKLYEYSREKNNFYLVFIASYLFFIVYFEIYIYTYI